MRHLKDDNGTQITDRVAITNMLGAAIENNSSLKFYSIYQGTKGKAKYQLYNRQKSSF